MMYKIDNQITITEFIFPFGKLDPNNRWVKIAELIPWQRYEERYATRFPSHTGNPAIRFRMAFGTLIIKQRTGFSDEETLQSIRENPYMQFLIGLHEFTQEEPFSQSSITNFRKYISQEMINEINRELFAAEKGKNKNNDDNDGPANIPPDDSAPPTFGADVPPANKGTMLMDATCAPADIAYPTDVNLLNEAREKLEGIIDSLYPHTGAMVKPRTYRRKARKQYTAFIKQRQPRKKTIRKAIGAQLRFVTRNLKHVDVQLQTASPEKLTHRQREWLATIRLLYKQQRLMYQSKTHSVPNRIVSIGQPHVRPIVRNKVRSTTEFGAKVSVHMVDGYAFMDRLGWEAYNEEALLIPTIEAYKEQHGCYPVAVMADRIYRNRDNLAFCKKRDIRLSGPRLGRPPKVADASIRKQAHRDAAARNAIEGKFGEGKTRYGLDRVMARLQNTSETVIAMVFLCMNIGRRLRTFLFLLSTLLKLACLLVDNRVCRQRFVVCQVVG